jgi:threonine/homoserine/homoserine lactone efflux protein
MSSPAGTRDGWRALRDGVVVGVTNPKAYILFGAVLPQFINRSAGHVPGQMLALALISVCMGLVSDCAWGVAASAVRSWFARSPRRFAFVGGAGGLAMIGVGVTIALTGRTDLPPASRPGSHAAALPRAVRLSNRVPAGFVLRGRALGRAR